MRRVAISSVVLGVTVAAIVVWLVLAHGSGGDRQESLPAKSGALRSRELTFAAAGGPRRTADFSDGRVQVGCQSASVFKGPGEGTINFRVRCSGQNRGQQVAFVVERYSLNDHPRLGRIASYSRVLSSSASPEPAFSGSCRLRQRVLGCRGEVSGAAVLSGRIWVGRSRRCDQGVAVVSVRGLPCTQGVCQGPLLARELATGKPRGC